MIDDDGDDVQSPTIVIWWSVRKIPTDASGGGDGVALLVGPTCLHPPTPVDPDNKTMPQNVAIAKKLHPPPISKFNASQRTLKGFLAGRDGWLWKSEMIFIKRSMLFSQKKNKRKRIISQKRSGRRNIPSPVADDFLSLIFFYTSFWPLPCFGGVLKLACMTLVGAIS